MPWRAETTPDVLFYGAMEAEERWPLLILERRGLHTTPAGCRGEVPVFSMLQSHARCTRRTLDDRMVGGYPLSSRTRLRSREPCCIRPKRARTEVLLHFAFKGLRPGMREGRG
jgi:hypothetical protein